MKMKEKNFVPGEFYHIYNRGNNKQKIFIDKEDYERFLKLLYLCNSKKRFKLRDVFSNKNTNFFEYDKGNSIVDVVAYTLMPNHYHILLFLPTNSTSVEISNFIKKISVGYSAYFNKKYNRSGTLFESRFKSTFVDGDLYLKYLFSYIHLNPIKLIMKDWKESGIQNLLKCQDYLEKYKYSSFIDWVTNEDRKEKNILNKLSYIKFNEKDMNFKNQVYFWLNYKNKF